MHTVRHSTVCSPSPCPYPSVQVLTRLRRTGESKRRDPCVERAHPVFSSPFLYSHTWLTIISVSFLTELWSLRPSSNARLRLFNQASAEVANIPCALAAIEPPLHTRARPRSRPPFELDVIHAYIDLIASSHFIEIKVSPSPFSIFFALDQWRCKILAVKL